MRKPVKRHLVVGATPHLDEDWLIIRMHENDLPQGLKFGKYIRVKLGNKTVVAKLRSNAMAEIKEPRVHQISLNKRLKQILAVKTGVTGDFYLSKATSLKAPYYTVRYHPSSSARKRVIWRTLGIVVLFIAIITLAILYFLMWR